MSEKASPDNTKLTGQWTHAYYSLLVLSAFLIPAMTCLAHIALSQITELSINGMTISERISLPALTAWYASVDTTGLDYIGALTGLIIIVLALIRHSIFSVIISGFCLVFCVLFMAVAQIAALLPFLRLTSVLF